MDPNSRKLIKGRFTNHPSSIVESILNRIDRICTGSSTNPNTEYIPITKLEVYCMIAWTLIHTFRGLALDPKAA